VAERSAGGAVHAIADGIARAAAAPAVLAGTLALTFLFSVFPTDLFSPDVVVMQYVAVRHLTPLGGAIDAVHVVTWLLVWSFLAGGILDRYARNRPTRGRGFFGACGAHFPAMLRLGVAEWLVWLAIARGLPRPLGYGAKALTLAAGLVFLYARVRLVVEDRRSAIGALLAGGRFIRRNPVAVAVFLIFAAALWIAGRLFGLSTADARTAPTLLLGGRELLVALSLFLVFGSWASAIALFQTRLAHASYTAAPPIEWPESPAAEAITNLSPSTPA
jgi:hypothetical protein